MEGKMEPLKQMARVGKRRAVHFLMAVIAVVTTVQPANGQYYKDDFLKYKQNFFEDTEKFKEAERQRIQKLGIKSRTGTRYKIKKNGKLKEEGMSSHKEYDHNGRLIENTYYFATKRDLIRQRWTYTYNSDGKITQVELYGKYYNKLIRVWKNEYNEDGRLAKQVILNGSRDKIQTNINTYEDTLWTKQVRKTESNTFTQTNKYDERGDLVLKETRDKDGKLRSSSNTLFVYGDEGRLILKGIHGKYNEQHKYEDGRHKIEAVPVSLGLDQLDKEVPYNKVPYVMKYELDSDGHLLSAKIHGGPSGSVINKQDQKIWWDFKYDERGNRIESRFHDNFDKSWENTYIYDGTGTQFEYDRHIDYVPSTSLKQMTDIIWTFKYDEKGNITEARVKEENGNAEFIYKYEYTYY